MKNDFKHTIDEKILLRQFQNLASDEDKEFINTWLSSNPQNKIRYEELEKLWLHSGSIADFQFINSSEDWEKVRNKINFDVPVSKSDKAIGRNRFYYWSIRIAAALILLLGISYLIYVTNNSWFQQEITMLINTTTNNKTEFKLADGTKVFLNENSELKYPEFFSGNERMVELKGEAFFEVTKNKEKPFVISTSNNAIIKVLGTSFNVNANNEKVIVQVVEGKVAFYEKNLENKKQILLKNEQGVLSGKNISKSTIDDLNFMSWKTGVLKFENESLDVVIKQLTKHFNKTILLQQKNLDSTKITSTFDNQQLTDILDELKLLLNVTYQSRNDSIFIFKSD